MAKRMLIDATHPEETRVVVLNGSRLEEFDFETSTKKQIKGNIYLAKITRVEPSLQAAFVEYGGNRHGFLAFSEIHPDYYRIPVSDREALIAEERAAVEAEERGEFPGGAWGGSGNGERNGSERAPAEPGGRRRRHRDDRRSPPRQGPEAASADHLPEAGTSDTDFADEGHDHQEAHEPSALASHDDHGFTTPDEETDVPAQATDEGLAPMIAHDDHPAEDSADQAPSAEGSYHADGDAEADSNGFIEAPAPVETIGGDDIEEVEVVRSRTRHFRHYKIQEVIKRRQILLIQVTKEERGNKGAALTTYLSLAGRYCVLMPNAGRGGGVSRKITSAADRRRLKELMDELEVPDGMGVIVRTAGSERSKAEIKRDYEYLMRLWDDIRELTLRSSAPALIYEEGNLIKRAIRDLYSRDIEDILVEGAEGYRTAKDFMRMLTPSHAARVKAYRDPTIPLFHRFQIDAQIDQIHNPVVQLRSGGYIVINPTEALVSIDVNSGRATRERNIEETATKTNLEAAEEIARQLRLRDLAGLVVIDFIDMEDGRNQKSVENRLRDAMKSDRARIQLGRISPFGLLELSRQRLRSSLIEASTQTCPHCNGTGTIRSTESTALVMLRALEEEGIRRRTAEIAIWVPTPIALYLLNAKRTTLTQIEQRYGFTVIVDRDDDLVPPAYRLERLRALTPQELAALPTPEMPDDIEEEEPPYEGEEAVAEAPVAVAAAAIAVVAPSVPAGEPAAEGGDRADENGRRRKRRRRKRRRPGEERDLSVANGGGEDAEEDEGEEGDEAEPGTVETAPESETAPEGDSGEAGSEEAAEASEPGEPRRRRRRRRRRDEGGAPEPVEVDYPSSLDFARDGREFIFDTTPSDDHEAAEPAPVSESAAVEPETPAASESVDTGTIAPAEVTESAEDAAPTRRRRPRRKSEASEADAPAPVDAEAAAPAKRPRRRKTADSAPSEAPAALATEPVATEPVAEAAPVSAPEGDVAAAEPPVAEPVTTEAPVAEVTAAPVSEETPAESVAPPTGPIAHDQAAAEPAPEPAPVAVEAAPDRPRRSGWWQRLSKG